MWANGGLPCGEWPDLKLARNAFIGRLEPGEKALADRGYRDLNFFELPNGDIVKKKNTSKARDSQSSNQIVRLYATKISTCVTPPSSFFPCLSQSNTINDYTRRASISDRLMKNK